MKELPVGLQLVEHYLEDNEYDILSFYDEHTVIAKEGDTLAIIDVKVREQGAEGLPETAITKKFRTRMESVATNYLMKSHVASARLRFDVIAIQMLGDRQCLLRHHKDAFSTDHEEADAEVPE